jgi:type IV secretion system protein VirB10
MSQHNIPGNEPNNGHDDQRYNAGNGPDEIPNNPYYGRSQAEQAPNLDAGAPQLRSSEEQRLNRKALLFLGGILVLIIAMGFLLLRKSSSDSDAPTKLNETARVSTPELPTVAPTQAPPTMAEPIPMIPPLPTEPRGPIRPDSDLGQAMSAPQVERGPTLLDRRISGGGGVSDGQSGEGGSAGGMDEYTRAMLAQMSANSQPQQPQQQKMRRGPDVEDVSNASFIRSPDALLVRGTYLRCVLETRIITDIAGYTSCLLTEPVYSINGRSLLLPKGSKIYGAYGGGPTGERVEVIWDRITTPNGIDVAMSSPGIDQLGGAGHPGQYSAHWGSRIASALMISLIADAFKYAAAEHGPETTTVTGSGLAVQSPYESATARSMERLANEAMSQRRPPTVTINQGTVVSVYVAKDVDFSDVLPQRR